jgi:probable HAF family extracellular repeat protein
MIRTKVTRTLALTGLVPAGKLGHSYGALLTVVALCMATAAWSQTPPTFKGGRVPPNVFTGVRQPTPAAVTPASAQYRFVSIGIPGSTGAYPYGINNAGLVTGFYSDASFNYHGFVWQNGTFHTLDNPGSVDTALSSVSNRGVAMGAYGDLTTVHAAMYSFPSAAWTALPDISGMTNNEGEGINDFGVAVGIAGGGDFNDPSNVASWIWDPSAQSYSFLAVPGATQYSTNAFAINDSGHVVGVFDDANGTEHGFLKEGEAYTNIDLPGATGTFPYNINSSGTIVGQWANLSGWAEGFVRTSDGVFTVVDVPGALESVIGGINDRGDICGYWVDLKTGVWTAFVAFKR